MSCNRFIGETLVHTFVAAAAAMYQEQVPSYKHFDY